MRALAAAVALGAVLVVALLGAAVYYAAPYALGTAQAVAKLPPRQCRAATYVQGHRAYCNPWAALVPARAASATLVLRRGRCRTTPVQRNVRLHGHSYCAVQRSYTTSRGQ